MRDFNKNRGFGGGGGGRGFGGRGGFGGRDSGRPPARMYDTTCSDCGQECEVPFKPIHGKPVYCNNCFRKENDRSEGRDSGKFSRREERPSFRDRDRDNRDRQMHEATCDECGEKCEVPFRPTGDKPVYCRDCFGSSKGKPKDFEPTLKKPQQPNPQMDQLNAKLDKILKALEIIMQKKEFIVERSETKPEVKAKTVKVSKPSKPKKKK